MAELPDRLEPGQLRASDQDRERVAEVLRTAAAAGRLDLDEVDERLNAVYAAKTYADLEPLLRDLPASSGAAAPLAAVPGRADTVVKAGRAFAILGGFTRKGRWAAPRRFTALTLLGGGTIDLREALFPPDGLTIRAFTILGGVEVIVPEEAEVEVTGIGIMGGFDHDASGAGEPGGPRVVVTGLAFLGGVGVERKPPRKKKRKPEITG